MSKQPSQSKMQPLVDGEIPPRLQTQLDDSRVQDKGVDTKTDNNIQEVQESLFIVYLNNLQIKNIALDTIDPNTRWAVIRIHLMILGIVVLPLVCTSMLLNAGILFIFAVMSFFCHTVSLHCNSEQKREEKPI